LTSSGYKSDQELQRCEHGKATRGKARRHKTRQDKKHNTKQEDKTRQGNTNPRKSQNNHKITQSQDNTTHRTIPTLTFTLGPWIIPCSIFMYARTRAYLIQQKKRLQQGYDEKPLENTTQDLKASWIKTPVTTIQALSSFSGGTHCHTMAEAYG
jgi:hypothetical protein